jgi:hypothetical protein
VLLYTRVIPVDGISEDASVNEHSHAATTSCVKIEEVENVKKLSPL